MSGRKSIDDTDKSEECLHVSAQDAPIHHHHSSHSKTGKPNAGSKEALSRMKLSSIKAPIIIKYFDAPGDKLKGIWGCNYKTPMEFDNDHFSGKVLLKAKTKPMDPYFAPYFENKSRTFEFMVEGKVKHSVDKYDIFIGAMLLNPLKVGLLMKTAVNIAKKLIHSKNPGAHVTLGDDNEPATVSFPFGQAIDRLVVSKPGETPPEMGIFMFPEQLNAKERAEYTAYNTNDTYSVSMHSMYVDFARWKVVNLPGLPEIDLKSFIGKEKVLIVAYLLPKGYTGPHLGKDKQFIFCFELSNVVLDQSDYESDIQSQLETSHGHSPNDSDYTELSLSVNNNL